MRPYLESHGGDVELLEVADGVARIRLEGSCKTCPASSATLELAIKQALDEAAPDLEGLIVEGHRRRRRRARRPACELPVLQVAPGDARGDAVAGDRPATGAGPAGPRRAGSEARSAQIGGVPLLVARVDGTLLAFRDSLRRLRRGALGRARCSGACSPARSAGGATTCRAPAAPLDDGGSSSSRSRSCRRRRRVRVALAVHDRRARTGTETAAGPRPPDRRHRQPGRPGQRPARRCRSARSAPRRRRPTSGERRPAADSDERCDLCGTPLAPRPPPPAAPRPSAASSAPARPAWRCARASPTCGPSGTRVVWLDELRAGRRALGSPRDPDRRSPSSRSTARPARPSRSTRARPARPSASSTSTRGTSWSGREPGARRPRARRRGVHRQPDVRPAAARDRSRSTSATGWSGRSRWRGRGSPAASGVDEAIAGVLRRAAGAAVRA